MALSDFPQTRRRGGRDGASNDEDGDLTLQDRAAIGAAVSNEVSESDYQELAEKEAERLQTFQAVLAKRRDEWVRARASVGMDARWVLDVDQFNGEDSANMMAANMMVSVEQGFPVTTHQAHATRSTVFVQVTRQKTNAAVARLGDILLPTEERNFSLQPTPLPVMPGWVKTQMPPVYVPPAGAPAGQGAAPGDGAPQGGPAPTGLASQPGVSMGQGAPATPQGAAMTGPANEGGAAQPGASLGQPAPGQGGPGSPAQGQPPSSAPSPEQAQHLAEQAEAKKRADLMQSKIEDCLDQADYNAESRKLIYDAGVLGTGVLKGPVVLSTVRKSWLRSTDTMGRPVWALEVNKTLAPASFRVDPRNLYPDPACGDNLQDGRGIFELQRVTPKQVRDMAKQPGYITSQLIKVLEEKPKVTAELRPLNDGLRQQRDLVADEVYDHWLYWGEINRDDLAVAGVKLKGDELTTLSACVEMINNTVVRAYVNPLPDGQLPYDFFQWERRPGSIWGYGVPYLMRSQQRVINAAWRMILDNAGVSSGPQIVIKPGLITPADQQWTLTSRKIWYATDDVEDVSKAFATFDFPSHQPELQAIIEMAEKLSDAETAVPMMAQGERGNSPETLGGMQMLMQSANVVLKRLVKQYDDSITKPHIRRYYDYLMEYDGDQQLKGDYQVVALGSSSLVVRDVQNQALTQMLQLAANPVYAPLINSKNLFMKALRAQHLDPTDVMNTDAEIAAIQKAQQEAAAQGGNDPRVAAAQMRSAADRERTQAQTKVAEETLASKERLAAQANQMRMAELSMMRDIELLKVSQQQALSVEQVKAQLAAVAIKERTKVELHASDRVNEADPGAMADNDAQRAADMADKDQERLHTAAMQAMQQKHDQRMQAQQQEHDQKLAAAQRRAETRAANQAAGAKKPAAKRAK